MTNHQRNTKGGKVVVGGDRGIALAVWQGSEKCKFNRWARGVAGSMAASHKTSAHRSTRVGAGSYRAYRVRTWRCAAMCCAGWAKPCGKSWPGRAPAATGDPEIDGRDEELPTRLDKKYITTVCKPPGFSGERGRRGGGLWETHFLDEAHLLVDVLETFF